jgi:hypothetical protein
MQVKVLVPSVGMVVTPQVFPTQMLTAKMEGFFVLHFYFEECKNGKWIFQQHDSRVPAVLEYQNGESFFIIRANKNSPIFCQFFCKKIQLAPQGIRFDLFTPEEVAKLVLS